MRPAKARRSAQRARSTRSYSRPQQQMDDVEPTPLHSSTTSDDVRGISAINPKYLALGMVAILVFSFAAILFIMYQLILGGGGTSTDIPGAPTKLPITKLQIPPGAREFTSLADFEKAGRLPAGQLFALTLTEAELNGRLADVVKQQADLPFREPRLRVLDDKVQIDTKAKVASVELSPTVEMTFFPQNGRLGYEITRISFGPLPVPAVARSAVSDAIERSLSGSKLTEAWNLQEVQMRVGTVIILARMR